MKYDITATLKAINRYLRRAHVFAGGRDLGIDKTTWIICHSQIANTFSELANKKNGTSGKFYFPRDICA